MIPPSDDDGGGEPPRKDEATTVSSSSLLVLSLRIAPFFVFLGAVPPAPAGALVCGPVRLGGCLLLLPFAALALALDLVLALDLALLVLLDLEAGFLIMMEDNEWRGVSLLEYSLVGPRTCLDLLVSILVMCRWVRRACGRACIYQTNSEATWRRTLRSTNVVAEICVRWARRLQHWGSCELPGNDATGRYGGRIREKMRERWGYMMY